MAPGEVYLCWPGSWTGLLMRNTHLLTQINHMVNYSQLPPPPETLNSCDKIKHSFLGLLASWLLHILVFFLSSQLRGRFVCMWRPTQFKRATHWTMSLRGGLKRWPGFCGEEFVPRSPPLLSDLWLLSVCCGRNRQSAHFCLMWRLTFISSCKI